MSGIKRRRRQRAARYTLLMLGLAAIGLVYAAVTGAGGAASAATPGGPSPADIAQGKAIFADTCSSCHGMNAQGTPAGPGLMGAGAAAVDFQMSTGRMPGKDFDAEMPRKPVTFTTEQIHQVAAYISSLGGGPAIPSAAMVDPAGADLALGQQLFITNCAQCHNFAGAGGALTYGKSAPALTHSTPTQIYEAMLTGPEAMPVFADGALPPQAKRDIIAYITQTRVEPNPGGFSLGRTGPVTEGLVIFLGGLGFLVIISMWITAKRRDPRPTGPTGTERK